MGRCGILDCEVSGASAHSHAALIRANWSKLTLGRVKRLPEPAREKVYEGLGAVRADVREAGMLEWRPAVEFAGICDVIRGVLGQEGTRELFRDVMQAAYERRFLHPIVAGALALYGRNPGSLYRMTAQAYALTFRNCGKVFTQRDTGPNTALLLFEALPAEFRRSPGMQDCYVGNAQSGLSYLGFRGSVDEDRSDLDLGRYTLRIEWEPRED